MDANIIARVFIARSSNGRTHGSGPCSEGSSPSRAVLSIIYQCAAIV